jgi:biotin carboxyl carrier protein
MSTTAAKVRTLRVLPLNAANLCFSVDGIVGEFNVALGQSVAAFDFATFYAGLGATVTGPTGDQSSLKYNSQAIHDDPSVKAASLLALRAGSISAVLDKAIAARQNIYYKKYFNQRSLINQITTNINAKTTFLGDLVSSLVTQFTELTNAYQSDTPPRIGVVKSTTNVTTTSGTTTITGSNNYTTETTTSNQSTWPVQTVTNTDYGYRAPYWEMGAQYLRAQLSLQDQQLAQWMSAQTIPNLATILTNELAGIDLDVRRLQIAYLDTILVSPISGIVSGIRKNLGDHVKAGEPVVRVEDNSNVLLVGTLTYPGVVTVNSNVSITTLLPGSANSTTINGTIVGVGGRKSDEQWGVVVQCGNMLAVGLSGGSLTFQQILPLHFSLDRDTTTVQIP